MNRNEIFRALREKTRSVDWDAVYDSELRRIYNYFLYKVCNREIAQDLTATTFERAWQARHTYKVRLASPGTWLLGIARNIFREHLRRNKIADNLEEILQDPENLPSPFDVEQSFQERQDKVLLQRFLCDLPERDHDLVALKYGAGLTNREIANVTGLSESNVGSILHRAVTALRKKWDECHE